MNLLNEYENGNYLVRLYDDGTKERLFNESPNPITPESIDIKITDYCDAGCSWCHEKSSKEGKHSDLSVIKKAISPLPPGAEIAVGGGHALDHPDILDFLEWAKEKGIVSNLTVNSIHLSRDENILQKLIKDRLIHGLGMSYSPEYLNNYFKVFNSNVVFHMIAGLNKISELDRLINRYGKVKVLVLGYKNKGRGKEYLKQFGPEVENNIKEWYNKIEDYFGSKNILVSFDNLAIEQLDIKRLLPEKVWNRIYMGDDGQYTMYIDAVKQEYTVSSTTEDRHNFDGKDVIEMFKHVRRLSSEAINS